MLPFPPRAHSFRSLVICDPHGEWSEEFIRQRMFASCASRSRPRVIYLDPTLGQKEGLFPTLNPFEMSSKSWVDRHFRADVLVSVVQSLCADQKLSVPMQTVLLPCIHVLLARPNSTLFDLLRFFQAGHNADLVAFGKARGLKPHRDFFRFRFEHSLYRTTKAALVSRLQHLLNQPFCARVFGASPNSFSWSEVLNSGAVVVVNAAVGRLGELTTSAILKFVTALTLSTVLSRAQSPHARHCPIWFFMDEMRYGVCPQMEAIFTDARKFGLFVTGALQHVGQGLTPAENVTILGNTDLKFVGHSGSSTRQAMAKELFLSGDAFQGLETGQFVVGRGKFPAIKIRIGQHYGVPRICRYTGRRRALAELSAGELLRAGLMSKAQWCQFRRKQLDRFYRVSD